MSIISTVIMDDGIACVSIDSPPVNALGFSVRSALLQELERLDGDDAVRAVLIACAGSTFFVGADISEFGHPPRPPLLPKVLEAIEASAKPVLAAIHGFALGGGYELALACHYRIAASTAKFGLPEVKLGLLPAAGGTQRLPRIVGPVAALDIIVHGDPVSATEALNLGMIDALAPPDRLREEAIDYTRRILAEGRPLPRVSDRVDKIGPCTFDAALFDRFKARNLKLMRGFKAPAAIMQAIEAAVSLPFDQGIKREQELFLALRRSSESAAQRYYFFAERRASKNPSASGSMTARPIKSAGIIGKGGMAGEIATSLRDAGIPVILLDRLELMPVGGAASSRSTSPSTLERENAEGAREAGLTSLRVVAGLEEFAHVDIVIDADLGELPIKQELFQRLDGISKPGAILASTTSFLDIDTLAMVTSRPASVVGLRFSSPFESTRLVEIVRGRHTADEVLEAAVMLARKAGKVPVLSGVCNGLIADRILSRRAYLVEFLYLEGARPTDIDAIFQEFGFSTPARSAHHEESTGQGAIDKNELLHLLLYPIVNEGARLLEEEVAFRASDIDVAAIAGCDWPVYRGGPMFWGDTIGLAEIVSKLREFEVRFGREFRPCEFLIQKASAGVGFTRELAFSAGGQPSTAAQIREGISR